jgi:hypothetical protein
VGLSGQPGGVGPAFTGGIRAPSDPGTPGLVTAISTIIALNTDSLTGLGDVPDDGNLTFAQVANTLLQDGDGAAGIANGVAGNLVGMDPRLGPLQGNGGLTPTMALLPGSPAIDAGSNTLNLTSDQRGFSPRIVGAAADIGAYEVGAMAPPGPGGGDVPTAIRITAKVVRKKRRREILVYDADTGTLRFAIDPFGRSYRGRFQVTTADVAGNGVEDVLASYRRGRKLVTWTYSGLDGSMISIVQTGHSPG